MARILWVAGGRDYDDEASMRRVLRPYADFEWTLITGAQRGADLMAEDLWRSWQCRYIGVPAKWTAQGKRAGPQRNLIIAMHYKPQMLVWFPGHIGTADAVKVAAQFKIETVEALPEEPLEPIPA